MAGEWYAIQLPIAVPCVSLYLGSVHTAIATAFQLDKQCGMWASATQAAYTATVCASGDGGPNDSLRCTYAYEWIQTTL